MEVIYQPNLMYMDNLQQAWEGINEFIVNNEELLRSRGALQYSSMLVGYDFLIYSKTNKIDPKFDFGKVLGYKEAKWSKLLNNYLNYGYLDLVKSQVLAREGKNGNSKQINYNYTYHFDNQHKSGKDCLISLTFSRRKGNLNPVVIYNTRASEVTKRLIFDFLLIQRLSEYVYGKDRQVEVISQVPYAFVNCDCFMMYLAWKGKNLLIPNKKGGFGKFQQKLLTTYDKFLNTDWNNIKYKVSQRAAKQVHVHQKNAEVGIPPLYAKKLKITGRIKYRIQEIDALNQQ